MYLCIYRQLPLPGEIKQKIGEKKQETAKKEFGENGLTRQKMGFKNDEK
jgi:hypothetical protein